MTAARGATTTTDRRGGGAHDRGGGVEGVGDGRDGENNRGKSGAAALRKIICVNNGQARPQHHETSAARSSTSIVELHQVRDCYQVSARESNSTRKRLSSLQRGLLNFALLVRACVTGVYGR